jgi:hypothetical protein
MLPPRCPLFVALTDMRPTGLGTPPNRSTAREKCSRSTGSPLV